MKSIIEQASSIAKAIEKGWERAGKPANFTVKVLELPEKNFFGLSTKPAKIAVLYEEKKAEPTHSRQRSFTQEHKQKAQKIEKTEKNYLSAVEADSAKKSVPKNLEKPSQKIKRTEKSVEKLSPTKQGLPQAQSKEENVNLWTEQMMEIAQNWLNNSMAIIGITTPFTLQSSGRNLKIVFEAPLYQDEKKQRLLLNSFSYLIMETLRAQLKTDLRGARITLECNK